MIERSLPGEYKMDPVEFLDVSGRLGMKELHELAALFLDVKYAALLSASKEESAILPLARAQGVREFVRWISETRDEIRETMERI